jgi:ATP/ADP translocase
VTAYTVVEPTKFLHLWEVPLILSLLLTGVTVFFLAKGSIEWKDDRLSERIALPFLVLLMSFAILTFTVQNLNCALDTSKPTAYTVTVKDKHRSAGKMTRCFLTVTVEGQELDLNVAASDYRETEVGDPVVVEVYEGAFGKAYCILRELP